MRKMISKKLGSVAILGIFGLGFLSVPVLLQAQGRSADTPARNRTDSFCQSLNRGRGNFDDRYDSVLQRLEQKRSERTDRIETRRMERDAKRGENRASRDTNRERHFAAIEERAQNEEQKDDLARFQLAVNIAIENRRAAINEALEDFREGMDELIAERRDYIEDVRAEYLSRVRAAFARAQASCTGGGDAQAVRQTLHESLTTAREQFRDDIKAVAEFRTRLDELISARREAVAQAIADFREQINEARALLAQSE